MKIIRLFLLITVVQILCFSNVFSQPVAKAILPNHPRLLLFSGEEKNLSEKVVESSIWEKVQKDIFLESNKIIKLPCLENIKTGKRLLSVSREALRRIFFLSYAYRVTNEDKYFVRAEQELLNVSQFKDWNPSHFLDVAEMTMGVSIGYDWLYNRLSPSSRYIIKTAIINKGIEPSFDSNYNGFLKVDNNWNQVCNAGIAFGALTVYEDIPDLSEKTLQRAIESIKLPMKTYGPDGAYAEGYGYWKYGTNFNVMFLAAIEKIYNTDFGLLNISGFLNTATYYENMVGSSGLPFNYSDCEDNKEISPAMFWFANKEGSNSLLWNERKVVMSNDVSLTNERLLPSILLWGTTINLKNINPPQNLIWIGQGKTPVSLMRSYWTDPNAVFVGFKGGSAATNHAHMDVGSFVMEANGVRWAMDFGMQNYESLESKGLNIWSGDQSSQRWSIFRYNNFAHNTLTVNNQLHIAKGYSKIDSYSSDSNFISSVSDLSQIFENQLFSCVRGIAIIDKEYVLIRDEIKTLPNNGATTIRWSMLTSATPKIKNRNTIELTENRKKLYLKVIGVEKITMKTWSTKSKNDFDADNTGTVLVGFEINLPPNTTKALSVILLPEKAKLRKDAILDISKWPKDINKK